MVKYYSLKISSSVFKDEKIEEAKKELGEIDNIISFEISPEYGYLKIEAEPDDFTFILNQAVNIFRRIDAKSEVKYDFALNGEA